MVAWQPAIKPLYFADVRAVHLQADLGGSRTAALAERRRRYRIVEAGPGEHATTLAGVETRQQSKGAGRRSDSGRWHQSKDLVSPI